MDPVAEPAMAHAVGGRQQVEQLLVAPSGGWPALPPAKADGPPSTRAARSCQRLPQAWLDRVRTFRVVWSWALL